MKYTLLEMVKHILSSLDGDEVDSISDTTESLQVAEVLKGVYSDLTSGIDFPEKFDLYQLKETAKPIVMMLPDKAQSLLWIKYNIQDDDDVYPNYKPIPYTDLDNFCQRTLGFNTQALDSTLDTIVVNNITFTYRNDLVPSCYTTFNDHTILFDSLDISVDDNLKANKTIAYGKTVETWEADDCFIPALDSEQFSLLINKAKDRAFTELKQTQNINAIKETRFQLIHQQRTNKAVRDPNQVFNSVPNFGRRPR